MLKLKVRDYVSMLGGPSTLAKFLHIKPATVCGWYSRNNIPTRYTERLYALCQERGLNIQKTDLNPLAIMETPTSSNPNDRRFCASCNSYRPLEGGDYKLIKHYSQKSSIRHWRCKTCQQFVKPKGKK